MSENESCVNDCDLVQKLLDHQKMLLNFIYVLIIALIASNLGEKILSIVMAHITKGG